MTVISKESTPGPVRGRIFRARLGTLMVSAVILAVLVAFAYAAGVVERFPGDTAGVQWVQSWRASWLDAGMRAVSSAGLEIMAAVLVLLAALGLYIKGRHSEAGLVIGATVFAYGLRTVVKLVVARPRPPVGEVQVLEQTDGFSFPSGHVMHYVVFLGTLLFILSNEMKSSAARSVTRGAVGVAVLLMGLSRVYLGVHWPSDVVAGYAFGGVVVVGAFWTWKLWLPQKEQIVRADR